MKRKNKGRPSPPLQEETRNIGGTVVAPATSEDPVTKNSRSGGWRGSIPNWIAAVAAAGALISAGISYWNVTLAERQVVAMTESGQRDQRAIVGILGYVGRGSEADWIKEGDPAIFRVTIKNFGKNPAQNVQHAFTAKLFRKGSKFEPSLKETAPVNIGTLLPTVELTLNSKDDPPHIFTDAEIYAVRSGKWVLYVYGKVTYESFGSRYSEFCGVLDPGLRAMNVCETFNESN